MGTIYLKADLNNITADNINQFNINNLNYNEVHDLVRAGHRKLLFQIPTTPHIQYYLHNIERLTMEECEMIIRNSTEIWDDIGELYEYSSEFLMENGEKLSRLSIESQRNITPEFVFRYYKHLSLRLLLIHRERFGDEKDFLIFPEICCRYLNQHLIWNSSKESLIDTISKCNLNEDTFNNALQFINNWFDSPIDIQKLINDYQDQERAAYTVDVVTNYWNNHSSKQKYKNWEEYANECENTGDDGLAKTWFQSFLCGPLLEIIGYND